MSRFRQQPTNGTPRPTALDNYGSALRPRIVRWTITASGLHEIQVYTANGRRRAVENHVQLGANGEHVSFDGRNIEFVGTVVTSITLRFGFVTGDKKINWIGDQLEIDDVYTLSSDSFNYWARETMNKNCREVVGIDGQGVCDAPMTLTHHGLKYSIRLDGNSVAIVLPYAIYAPFQLAALKEFTERFVPRNWYRRDARLGSPASLTSNEPSNTPPISYVSPSAECSTDRCTTTTEYGSDSSDDAL